MKKLLALISVTTLIINSGVGGILLSNDIQNNINKIKNADNNSEIDNESLKLLNNLLPQLDNKQNYNSITNIIDFILPFINNKSLSNDLIIKIIEKAIKGLKASNPEIVEYLSYAKYGSFVSLAANELANDWDQQKDNGNSPLVAMKNYIASKKGNIAQAKNAGNKGQWHYVAVRAGHWNWNDFYQYIAGANLNYMIKILSNGNYIGNLINRHLDIGPWKYGFNLEGFLNDLTHAMKRLTTAKEALPYLFKAIIPILKTNILKQENPTIGYDYLTWKKTNQKDLSLQTLLGEIKRLLSPSGRSDLVNILASLLTGPFGEDIIIDVGTFGYYTFPEILGLVNSPPISWIIGNKLKPSVISETIVNQLIEITNDLGINNIVDKILTEGDKLITENIKDDFKLLSSDLNKIYVNDNFETGLDQLIDIINNPESSPYSLKEIFQRWGTQNGKDDFKTDSPLFIIKKWIDEPNSIFNQILNILRKIDPIN